MARSSPAPSDDEMASGATEETNGARPDQEGEMDRRMRKRKRRFEMEEDPLGRQMWLPLKGMTLQEEREMPLLAKCPT
eukprot:3245259-Rhodomonas_salina.1